MNYCDLAIRPEIIIREVMRQPAKNPSEKCFTRWPMETIEKRRLAMNLGEQCVFIYQCEELCMAAYAARSPWFLKIVRSRTNRGRDTLYDLARHWLIAYIGQLPARPDPFAGERFRLVNRESGAGDQTPARGALRATGG